MTSVKKLYELLTSPGTEVTKLIFPKDVMVCVSWKNSEDYIVAGKNVNVAVAAYVTILARLKLYECLCELGQCVLYCDTDSVTFIQNVYEPPKVRKGDNLGHLTDELEEFGAQSFIELFVSGGQNTMRFLILDRRTHDQM